MITGEVLLVEGEDYLVKGQDGKVARLHIDETTQMTGRIGQGEHIEAEVNNQNHALSIRSDRGADVAWAGSLMQPWPAW